MTTTKANGPAFTPVSQRRLRHLKCIMARSLQPRVKSSPFALGDFYYTLHAPSMPEEEIIPNGDEPSGNVIKENGMNGVVEKGNTNTHEEQLGMPFYTSEVVVNSMNPIWRHFDCSQFNQLDFLDSMFSFNLCVWDCTGPITTTTAYPHVNNSVTIHSPSTTSSLSLSTSAGLSVSATISASSHHSASTFSTSSPPHENYNGNHTIHQSDQLPILQIEIDLSDLEFVATELRNLDFSFPPNSLIFELKDGIYVTKETRDKMRPNRSTEVKTQYPPDKRKAVTCNQATFLSLVSRRKQFLQTQESVKMMAATIEKKLIEHQDYFEKLRKRDALRLRITRLREECESHTSLLKTEEDVLKVRRAELLPRARSLARAQIALLASKQQLANQEIKALEKDKVRLGTIQTTLDHRRWRLINQIKALYPITHSTDNKSLSINGYKLPNSDFTGCDEEQIATSLGCVSHILYLAAKYLEVPLRYPMIPMCSRSVILDEISQQTSPKFPLYSRGVDRTRFEYAVFLLNKNLEQLMNSQGFEIISLRHTLPNVQILLTRGQNLNV